ncbi:hypothetical protein [Flavobacterium kingsejongi]|uniref:Lipoprotein n=1 Tax=Flavobacterium kingsejongi TaxID=1678728 RepID=A0A2S1LUM3_9FLAO|nr:hypothetical protein [Flavobacterium kingsejongi]AWG27361.1 hypothetical protein FK004_15260 [Flavobacterium kingsejongi]
MKKITFLIVAALLVSCGVRQTTNMISSGDFDGAIDKAINNLRTNKTSKGKQDYIYLLEEAFAKAKERDLRDIDFMVREANPNNLERIYVTYVQLKERQEKIRPILPLPLIREKRDAIFPFDDYFAKIISSRDALSKHLYANSKALLLTNDKMAFRRAYDDFAYLEQINPNYKDTRKLMEEAQFKGTDFVRVYAQNQTNSVIPVQLERDLLDFSTYGLDDKWTVYHNTQQKNVYYDYGLAINFRNILISPEQVSEKEFTRERQIKDGYQNLLDSRGNVVKDSLGKAIQVDRIVTLRAIVREVVQFKSTQLNAQVDYIDLRSNQLIQSFPLSSRSVFENVYAGYKGDKDAIEQSYYIYFMRGAMPFPSNEQMVYDTGENLKLKLKNILNQNQFRQ